MEGGSFARDLERWMKEALEVECRSVRGTWRGLLLYWEPWRMCKGRFWRRASLSPGPRWGTWMGLVYWGPWKMNERGL